MTTTKDVERLRATVVKATDAIGQAEEELASATSALGQLAELEAAAAMGETVNQRDVAQAEKLAARVPLLKEKIAILDGRLSAAAEAWHAARQELLASEFANATVAETQAVERWQALRDRLAAEQERQLLPLHQEHVRIQADLARINGERAALSGLRDSDDRVAMALFGETRRPRHGEPDVPGRLRVDVNAMAS